MQKRLQRLKARPRTNMLHTDLNGALRDLNHTVPRKGKSKKDIRRLLAKRLAEFGTSSQSPTFVVYFCGMGGVSLGALQAGYRILGAVDNCPVACSSYGLNLSAEVRDADLAHDVVSWDEEVDVMWASMPCQSFSSIGKRTGISDERGKLSVTFAKHLRTVKPRVFVFENAPNLININDGYDIGVIEKGMKSCGYKLSHYLLEGIKFGLCQKRKRLFIVRPGGGLNHLHIRPRVLIVAISLGAWPAVSKEARPLTIAGLGPKLTNGPITSFPLVVARRLCVDFLPERCLFIFQDVGVRKDLRKVAMPVVLGRSRQTASKLLQLNLKKDVLPAVRASGGGLNPDDPRCFRMAQLRNGRYKKLSVEDLMKMQGLSTSYKFPIGISDTRKRMLVGNAVCPPMAKSLLLAIRETLLT